QFSLTCSSRISHFVCAFFEIRNQTVKDQPLSPSVHCEAQPPTISHQISTVRKELSSNELGRTPSHRPDRLQADYQHTVPARPVKYHRLPSEYHFESLIWPYSSHPQNFVVER